MDLYEKLTILADSAKYDAACTSSGSQRKNDRSGIGSTVTAGCCHSFASDGRCISLLKVLLTNYCVYDCKYCVNRTSNDVKRAAFTPRELAELTIEFYRRNYIEGLFLSSGVINNPDHTMEQMIHVLQILRTEHKFMGYIHAKVIPGSNPDLVKRLGILADRLSVNIELPSEMSLKELAPHKRKEDILTPMALINETSNINSVEIKKYKNVSPFASAGQSTQMIIGASPESDYHILKLSEGLYNKYELKRVFYSAYIPVNSDNALPAIDSKPPLLREHRLYQADWMLRQYQFTADEILNPNMPNFDPYLDPKCNWAIHNFNQFPIDVNKASLRDLLRVPGIGPTSARRIVTARKHCKLGTGELKRLGVVLKRAKYFIIADDMKTGCVFDKRVTAKALIDPNIFSFGNEQLSLFPSENAKVDILSLAEGTLSLKSSVEEAVSCFCSMMQ